jgi:hypothetical protein
MPMLAITAIANFFGISVFRLAMYAAIVAAVVTGALVIRHHYVSLGYHKALADVKKQDDRAVEAATKVEKKTAVCTDQNGYWDVLSQRCILEDQK